jgi:class 3 adenylate cyclase
MVQRSVPHAQENPVTAIDIALEPDATMARKDDARRAVRIVASGEREDDAPLRRRIRLKADRQIVEAISF